MGMILLWLPEFLPLYHTSPNATFHVYEKESWKPPPLLAQGLVSWVHLELDRPFLRMCKTSTGRHVQTIWMHDHIYLQHRCNSYKKRFGARIVITFGSSQKASHASVLLVAWPKYQQRLQASLWMVKNTTFIIVDANKRRWYPAKVPSYI